MKETAGLLPKKLHLNFSLEVRYWKRFEKNPTFSSTHFSDLKNFFFVYWRCSISICLLGFWISTIAFDTINYNLTRQDVLRKRAAQSK
jgi:hypothetical protein